MANLHRKVLGSEGIVLNETMVCQFTHPVTSNGIFYGNNPFEYSSPLLMAQIILIFVVTSIIGSLLRPLHQSKIITQIVAGILIGPTVLTSNRDYLHLLFPPRGKLILDTFASFGFMLHLFILGVHIDMGILKRLGQKAAVIGFASFIFPLALGGSIYWIVVKKTSYGSQLENDLSPFLLLEASMTSFIVTTGVLTDLNILNSEIGRLAAYTSITCDTCGWVLSGFLINFRFATDANTPRPLEALATLLGYYGILFFIMRPFIIQMVENTPEGETLEDRHLFAILLMVLLAGLFGEILGQHAGVGAFMLGLSLPDGPPLGSFLIEKLDTIATGVLLPVFCTTSGLRTDIHTLGEAGVPALITELLLLSTYVFKVLTIMVVSLYFNMPFWDALTLSLIMCCKGVANIAVYVVWLDTKLINRKLFTVLVFTMVAITGIATPLVAYLYDPSKRYMSYQKTILRDSMRTRNLQILVCIHHEDNVPPIINLIEASNPGRGDPVFVFVLQLKELSGRASSILAPHHQFVKRSTSDLTSTERIVNAFNFFERQSHGNVVVQHFIAVAPYASMHNDICNTTVDKNICFAILPFHNRWAIDGSIDHSQLAFRAVNKKVLEKAPCSVGVLVDRSQIGGNQPLPISQSYYRIAMLYLGGADDQEALAYCRRVADNPNVSLKVVWIKPYNQNPQSNYQENLEEDLINDFKANALDNKRISYKEETVRDGVGTTRIIRSMEDYFDLMIVGKHHDPYSPVTSGLTEWNECPELGIIGDMLATSDFHFSVLVVQQPQGALFLDSPIVPLI